MAALQAYFERTPGTDKDRILMQTATMQKSTAAYMALRGAAETPDAVAQETYNQWPHRNPVTYRQP